MTKYRKKPVVIEATQWFKMGDHPEVKRTAYSLSEGWIETLEGGHTVTPGDWIITGVKGEHYPCRPDIFELTYELAQPVQEPVSREFQDKDGKWYPFIDHKHYLATKVDGRWPIRALYTAPPLPEERNFCPRCGKRTADLTAIHTCTQPPKENT